MTKQEIFDNIDLFRQRIRDFPCSVIPPNDRVYLANQIKKLPINSTIVEIGTFVAGTTRLMALARPDCKIYSVDINTWKPFDALLNHAKTKWNLAEVDDDILRLAQRINIEGCDNVKLVTSKSLDFDINNIDFLYLDGDHSHDAVLNELRYFWDRVKEGGVVMGDDINHEEPYDAVRLFCVEKSLEFTIYSKQFKFYKRSDPGNLKISEQLIDVLCPDRKAIKLELPFLQNSN